MYQSTGMLVVLLYYKLIDDIGLMKLLFKYYQIMGLPEHISINYSHSKC